jgi:hypothetical protein
VRGGGGLVWGALHAAAVGEGPGRRPREANTRVAGEVRCAARVLLLKIREGEPLTGEARRHSAGGGDLNLF